MFPNDDICNVDAARDAAKRLFSKYKTPASNGNPSLGKSEVNKLIKATYEAINMPYDPNEEDIFSFISVFDSKGDGQIDLKNLEEMAVKYLCGEEALSSLGKVQQSMPKTSAQKIKPEQKLSENLEKTEILSYSQAKEFENKQQYSSITIEKPGQIQNNESIQNANTPLKNYLQVGSQCQSKSKIEQKEKSLTQTATSQVSTSVSEQNGNTKLDELIKQGRSIFQKHSNTQMGVTENAAGKIIGESYQLLGMKNFKPNSDDVKIWMKLCDRNKDGIVDWQDYRYFLQRMFERNHGCV